MIDLISTKAIKNIALVGISKNAGKTTLINALIHNFPNHKWAVLSTGIDGESEDRVYKTPKPLVNIFPGNLFCCDQQWIDFHAGAISILSCKQYAGRKLYIAKAESELKTQITGPSSVLHQKDIIRHMHHLGANKVLVDGSLDRKSIALSDNINALILAVGASFGSTEQIIEELGRLRLLRDIAKADLNPYLCSKLKSSKFILYKKTNTWQNTHLCSLIHNEKDVITLLAEKPKLLYIPTSITDSLFEAIGKAVEQSQTQLMIRHPECLKLNTINLKRFLARIPTYCLIPFKLRAFALNSTAVGKFPISADSFRAEIRQAFPNEVFFDVMELQ